MKKVFIVIVILVLSITIIAFNTRPKTTTQIDQEQSYTYLSEKGYDIIEYKGRTTQIFSESHVSLYDIQVLTLINVDYMKYMDKDIVIDTYIVTNHPLDNNLQRFISTIERGFRVKYPNITRVQVAMCDNEIIGGYANIYHTGEKLLGRQGFDIDGKSIESVTGLTFDVWRDQVMKEIKFNY